MDKVKLPLDKLNEALDGGIKPGSNVLLLVDLLINKAEFAGALTNYRIEQDDDVIYYLNNKMPKYIKDRLDNTEEQVEIVDGFSAVLEEDTDTEYKIDSNIQEEREEYVKETKEKVKEGLEGKENPTFMIDSMDPFVGQWDEINDLLKSIESASEESGSVNYFLQPNIGYEEGGEEIEKMKENFDYVLHLKGLERSGFILKFIEILEPEVQTRVPYDTTPTGLAMYVPKMLVTGPTNAGKTETVKTMSETSVSAEEGGTTVALDNGQVSMKGIKADIFGTPGEKRFDWAMNFLGESIFGAFILVDSRDPNYERANEIKENLQEKEIPLLVLANFQNKDEANEPEEIEEKMGLETIPVDAKHGENLQQSLERLMEKILTEGDLKID